MSEPIIEQIAEHIKTTVAGVTVGAGYHQTLSPIRPRRSDYADVSPADGNVLIWQENDSPADAAALTTTQFAQEFMLICVVLDSDSETDSIDTRINRVKSDLRKALMADPTRGGLAIDTAIGASQKIDDGEGLSGIAVTVIVTYRTDLTDPYTQI